MTSVLPLRDSGSRPKIVQTYSESRAVEQHRVRFRRVTRVVPTGLIHAAEQGSERAMCGVLLSGLYEFGRSRHPFERVAADARCRQCDEAAGQPRH